MSWPKEVGYFNAFKDRLGQHRKSFIWFHSWYLRMSYEEFLKLMNVLESINDELKDAIDKFMWDHPETEKRSTRKRKDAN